LQHSAVADTPQNLTDPPQNQPVLMKISSSMSQSPTGDKLFIIVQYGKLCKWTTKIDYGSTSTICQIQKQHLEQLFQWIM